jgi:hypothetical protein
MNKLYKFLLLSSIVLGILAIGMLILGGSMIATGPFVIGSLVCLALGGRGLATIKQMTFTIWVFAAVALGTVSYTHLRAHQTM